MDQPLKTDVAIIGGGPAGLMLAIELGCRGIACTLLEEDATSPVLPKANATSARTMEHYRRRGFASQIRALGLPDHHPQDVVYTTRIAGRELTRFQIPSTGQARAQTSFGDYGPDAWPTPELPHRAQQMYIEPILKAQAESHPSVSVRFGARALAVIDQGPQVRVDYVDTASGEARQLEARYVVGCDGPRSLVRQTMGVAYAGEGVVKRDFLGGQMVSIYFRAPDLVARLGKPPAWQYWAMNRQQRGLLCAINGIDSFALLLQLADGAKVDAIHLPTVFEQIIGVAFDHELIALTPWSAGFALVAQQFRRGRLMLAGDAAHLFTPTGGMGYNTSVDDVVNLGWKLALVLQGHAPEGLLDSYQAERHPIAERNTGFARSMAESIGNLPVPADVEAPGAAGDAARLALSQALALHVTREFNIPGLQLGLCYAGSPIVARESAPPPPDEPNHYQPSGYPGARAPHLPVGSASLLDYFGRDFTLLVFDAASTADWEREAARLGLTLKLLRWADETGRALYGASRVLIRPDHHIAWRGAADAAAAPVLACATGRLASRPSPSPISSPITSPVSA